MGTSYCILESSQVCGVVHWSSFGEFVGGWHECRLTFWLSLDLTFCHHAPHAIFLL